MKHAISFYIDDEAEIIGFCGSIVVKTDYNKAITCFNLNEEQLKTNNAFHIGQNGKGTAINKEEIKKHDGLNTDLWDAVKKE